MPTSNAGLPPPIDGFGRIAWGASESGGSDIVVAAGVDSYRVAATEAEETNPVWSPDGEWLAYISSAAGGSVLVIGPDGQRVLHEGSHPRSSYYTDGVSWSPDSSRLALALVPGGIKIVDLNGATVREIIAVEPRHVAWSPAGELLAFTSGRELMVADVATGATRPVVSMDSDVRFPMWLTDEQTILFHGYTETGNTDLFAVALDGSGLRNITATSDLFEDVPAISPDGRRIAVVVDDGSERWVAVMNIDGSQRLRTVMDMTNSGAPVWSPDGTELVVADGTDIFEVPVEPGLPSFLIGHGIAPSWGRDPG